jgi:hypothetical protein
VLTTSSASKRFALVVLGEILVTCAGRQRVPFVKAAIATVLAEPVEIPRDGPQMNIPIAMMVLQWDGIAFPSSYRSRSTDR